MNDNEIQNNDEISLIDLFAVLIRYRKMIISIILCSIIVAIVGYFFYPSWQKSHAVTEITYETSIGINLTPGVRYLLSYPTSQVYLSFIPYFIFPQVIQDAIEDTQRIALQPQELLQWIPVQDPVAGEVRTYTSANKKLFLKENLRSGVLEITYSGDDPQSGIVFLQSLFLYGSMVLENHITPLAKTFINTYETSLLPAADNDYVMVKAICDGTMPVLVQLFEPYVLEQEAVKTGRKYSVVALVIVFAAVFFSIFLAFCINALKNLKNDQESMRKLREALRKTDNQ
jgi:hypothetical protein